MKVTISELLGLQQTVKQRYNELVSLRNQNAYSERRYYGKDDEKFTEKKPLYDVVKLDKLIAQLAREQRLIDVAIKKCNATVTVEGYEWDDKVLGELEAADATASN